MPVFYHPKPAPPAVFHGQPLPQAKANIFSRAVFWWISPIMRVGASRPLELDGECRFDSCLHDGARG